MKATKQPTPWRGRVLSHPKTGLPCDVHGPLLAKLEELSAEYEIDLQQALDRYFRFPAQLRAHDDCISGPGATFAEEKGSDGDHHHLLGKGPAQMGNGVRKVTQGVTRGRTSSAGQPWTERRVLLSAPELPVNSQRSPVENMSGRTPEANNERDSLLTDVELCRFLSVTRPTLRRFLRDPDDPLPCYMLGKRRRYDRAEVLKWAERQTRKEKLLEEAQREELGEEDS